MFIDAHTHKTRGNRGNAVLVNVEIPVDPSCVDKLSGRIRLSSGIHPWDISGLPEDELEHRLLELETAAANGYIDAVGECGLDKAVDGDFETQTRVFERQIELSDRFNLPLVIHCVRAYPEILSAAKKSRSIAPWILHGFNGNAAILAAFLRDERFTFSFGPAILRENAKIADAIRCVPLSRLLLETDDEDVNIECVYDAAAAILGIPVANLSDAFVDNWTELFEGKSDT